MELVLPSITPELTTRLEESIVFFAKQRQEALRALPGNPYGVHIRSFGKAIAFLAQNTYNVDRTSHVRNMSGDDLSSLDTILEWYDSYGIHCRFDIAPYTASPALLWQLAKKGWYQSRFYNVFYGIPQEDPHFRSPIQVRRVAPTERDVFASVYCESFEVPETDAYAYVRDTVRGLVTIPTNHCFFALVDDTVAAIGVLSLYGQIGYFALAATRPRFQRHGCQRALLQARLRVAMQQNCTLTVSQTAVTSASQRNVERVGLRLAYTKVFWTFHEEKNALVQEPDPLNR